jgi:hypothetical protein
VDDVLIAHEGLNDTGSASLSRHQSCNHRPHSALGYRPPTPESVVPIDQRPTMH